MGRGVRLRSALDAGRVRFLTADLERVPLADGCVDAVISNGAFCLAPDKPAAFGEVFPTTGTRKKAGGILVFS